MADLIDDTEGLGEDSVGVHAYKAIRVVILLGIAAGLATVAIIFIEQYRANQAALNWLSRQKQPESEEAPAPAPGGPAPDQGAPLSQDTASVPKPAARRRTAKAAAEPGEG